MTTTPTENFAIDTNFNLHTLPAKQSSLSLSPTVVGGIIVGIGLLTVAITVPTVLLAQRRGNAEVCDGVTKERCGASLGSDVQDVAEDCAQDVGSCSGDACEGCSDHCCSAMFEDAMASCGSDQVPFKKVISCSCQKCTNSRIAISGRISGDCTTDGNCEVTIKVDDVQVAQSDMAGFYSFDTSYPTSGDQIVLVASDDGGRYTPKSTVVNGISRFSQSYTNVDIQVYAPEITLSFDSTSGMEQSLGARSSLGMKIMENSITDEDGNAYAGTVTASVSVTDTDEPADAETISGQLEATVDGQQFPFVSYGVISVQMRGSNNEVLKGRMSIDIEEDLVTNASDTFLWKLDVPTGRWDQVASLEVGTARRRRKRRSSSSTLSATVDLSSSSQIYNIDALLRRYCYMLVRVFENEASTTEVTAVRLAAVYKRADGSWANYLKRRTNRWSATCLQVPCDRSGRTNIVQVQIQVLSSSFTISEPSGVSDTTKAEVGYVSGTTTFDITIPTSGSIPTSSDGPFYTDYTCFNSDRENSNYFRIVGNRANSNPDANNQTLSATTTPQTTPGSEAFSGDSSTSSGDSFSGDSSAFSGDT